jgi:hypothetical protein
MPLDEPTTATIGLLEFHTPPATESVSTEAVDTHCWLEPLMGGTVFTETFFITMHPPAL